MLLTQSLQFRYPGATALEFPDIQASPGNPLLVLGESGSGKTTLLHLLGGLLQPLSGTIQISGTDITALSGRRLDRFRGMHIGIVFQRAHFVEALSVRQNLELASYLPKTKPDPQRSQALIERLRITQTLGKSLRQLSAGEQQRVAIARALLNQPDVLLADEPTSALDDKNCDAVIQLLREAADLTGATLLIVTHDTRLKDQFAHQIHLD